MNFNPIVQRPIPGLIKEPQFFPGQVGVPGSDTPLGLRTIPTSKTLYVDNTHADASDDNDGTNPDAPLLTIQDGVDKLTNPGDTVLVYNGFYTESVVTGPWTGTGFTPNYCNIIGVGNHRYNPFWQSAAAGEPALDLRSQGLRISGFRFFGPTAAACINARHFDTGASDTSSRTVIDNCYFDGAQVGRYGIELHGGFDFWIYNNTFAFFNNAVAGGAIALRTGSTPTALPYRNRIYGNEFYENENHVFGGFNASFFIDNFFLADGIAFDPTFILKTIDGSGGGNSNIVTKNYFAGDYSIVGGYVAAATDEWGGNVSMDTAEAEVGDNGWTVARPA